MVAESVEADPEDLSGDEPVAEGEDAPEETELEFPTFEVEVPEELLEELSLEELELDDLEEVVEDDEEDEYLSEADARLKKELAAAKKERDYYKSLRTKDARKNWVEEAKKFFPLSGPVLGEIQADSRRSFLRQAKAAHETVLPFVKDVQDRAKEQLVAAKEKAREEAKAEAAKAWGKPTVGNEVVPDLEERTERLERARQNRDLTGAIKAMMGLKG
jgi:hypothetical protein